MAAATACNESEDNVRKKSPFVSPLFPILVNVEEVDAVATTTTSFSTVTELSSGAVIPDEIGPTRAVTPSRSISFRAASTATEACVFESLTSYTSSQPTPSAALASLTCSTPS